MRNITIHGEDGKVHQVKQITLSLFKDMESQADGIESVAASDGELCLQHKYLSPQESLKDCENSKNKKIIEKITANNQQQNHTRKPSVFQDASNLLALRDSLPSINAKQETKKALTNQAEKAQTPAFECTANMFADPMPPPPPSFDLSMNSSVVMPGDLGNPEEIEQIMNPSPFDKLESAPVKMLPTDLGKEEESSVKT